ncbi:uncharacterized protein LOC117122353 [Anneissia japonica]|uniref:uncharacterized protein LOC117122353 n=1 Tax=Anneissia japonica TaxID=1529436 RepID=UPI0014254D12|nr:uncharacterized protein LOC117122353 [Anneissia japonica]
MGTRNNQFSSLPCQQDPVLLPSPVEKYATYSMSNFSSLSSQQQQPSKFYGNATKRRGSPTKKQPSSQSSAQAQETLQAFLDQENNVECSYTFEDGPSISTTLEQDTGFLSSTFKKTSNNHSRHGGN